MIAGRLCLGKGGNKTLSSQCNEVKNFWGLKSIPWQMWQAPRRHGGGAGGVLVELLGQHARFLTSSQAPAGHRAALAAPPKFVSRNSSQYQAISLTLGQGRCFCMHKFLLCLSLSREGKQDCYIGSVDIKVNCLPRRRSGGVFFLRLLCLIWDKC